MAAPTHPATTFADADFATSFRLRLGQQAYLPEALCANDTQACKGAKRCATVLDGQASHVLNCQREGWAFFRTRLLYAAMASLFTSGGHHVLQEQEEDQWRPMVMNRDGEAVLDDDGHFKYDGASVD